MMKNKIILGLTLFLVAFQVGDQAHYRSSEGMIRFVSDAPLEIITATSTGLRGIIDTSSNQFAFSVNVNSFHGFNSPLQEQHFNENYMETGSYPTATFSGKIIEEINFSENGSLEVRAKGELNVHGINQERLIKADLKIADGIIYIKSDFEIVLDDHGIKIPRIVHQKISPEIKVEVECKLIQIDDN